MENEGNEILNTKELLYEIAGEVEVFNIRNNGNERMTFDGEDSDVVPSPAKKEKQNAKKLKHIQTHTFSNFCRDKMQRQCFYRIQNLRVFSPLTELLLSQTKQYANRDKNKPQFKVTFCETMGINRVFEIKSFFHVAEYHFLVQSHMVKVESLYDLRNENFSNLVLLLKIV